VFRSESFCKFVKACDLVLVDSDAMMTMFKATFAEHSEKVKVHRSPGVDTAEFPPRSPVLSRRALRLPEGRTTLVHVSGFQPHHDFKAMLDATKILEEAGTKVLLILIGHGPRWNEIKALTRKALSGDSVMMPGFVELEHIPSYLSAADICLNLVQAETLKEGNFRATKLFEYMACARPVIASVRPDRPVPPWATDTLLLVPPESPARIAEAVTTILAEPEEWELRCAAGREWVVRERSWEAVSRTTLSYLHSLVAEHNRDNRR